MEGAWSSRVHTATHVPASQPNYVGIDGVLEGLCPPYVTAMGAAVDQVIEEKFGPGGTYADAEVFAQTYKDKAAAASKTANTERSETEGMVNSPGRS